VKVFLGFESESAEEVGDVVAFLASPRAAWVSGASITVGEGEVYTSVIHAGGQPVVVKSTLGTDGGAAWHAPVCGNAKSFEQLYQDNVGQNVVGSFERYRQLQSEGGFLRSNE
jgi:hypothetical protein